ncbi:MAG TPA: PAS domain-containing protein, partial [Bacillota bacterium]|nr:PAS domain-containing protein [Bacillota bacterium]
MGMDMTSKNLRWLRQSGFLVLLTLGAISGNLFGIQMISGVYFWFGSISTLIVVSLFGSLWGALIALLSAWLVLSPGEQVIMGFIYVAEAFLVGQFLQHRQKNLLIADALFWGIVGMPLIWLFNKVLLNADFDEAVFMTLKSGVDGLFNALIANLIVTYLPVRRWAGQVTEDAKDRHLTMEQTLFSLLVLFILLPIFTFTVTDIRHEQAHIRDNIIARLQASERLISSQVKNDALSQSELLRLVSVAESQSSVAIVITDSKGTLLASSRPGARAVTARGEGQVTRMSDTVSLWIPLRKNHLFNGQDWSKAIYFIRLNTSGKQPLSVEISASASEYFREFQDRAISDLSGVLLPTLLALFFARLVSRKLTDPLAHLSRTTTDLPERLKDGKQIQWPDSKIREINLLIRNYRLMGQTLKDNFQEIQAARLQAEEEKLKSEAVIACIGDGVGIVNSDMEIDFQNQSLKEMLGEYPNRKCYEAYVGRSEPCRNCPVVMSISDGEIHRGEMVTNSEKGRIPIEITASPLRDATGAIVGGIEIIRDI